MSKVDGYRFSAMQLLGFSLVVTGVATVGLFFKRLDGVALVILGVFLSTLIALALLVFLDRSLEDQNDSLTRIRDNLLQVAETIT